MWSYNLWFFLRPSGSEAVSWFSHYFLSLLLSFKSVAPTLTLRSQIADRLAAGSPSPTTGHWLWFLLYFPRGFPHKLRYLRSGPWPCHFQKTPEIIYINHVAPGCSPAQILCRTAFPTIGLASARIISELPSPFLLTYILSLLFIFLWEM